MGREMCEDEDGYLRACIHSSSAVKVEEASTLEVETETATDASCNVKVDATLWIARADGGCTATCGG